ncbi:hypothetical protein E4U44_008167 [Claviceps purpurea]|nr:hypothetical protein E4U44_008167 [Claviceps purpurea]
MRSTTLLSKVLARTREDKGSNAFVNKFMKAMVAERDISTQEVMHILLDQPLGQSSRATYSVDCRMPDQHWKGEVVTRGDQIHESVGFVDKPPLENAWLRSRSDIPVLRVGRSPPDGLDELKMVREDHCQQHHLEHPDDHHGRVEEPEATAADDEHAEEYTEQDQERDPHSVVEACVNSLARTNH